METERPAPGESSRGHALLYMLPTIVQSTLPLITLPIFTRVLSREEYGLWGVATALGATVSGAAGLGLQVGFERNYFAASDNQTRGRLLYSVVLFALVAQTTGLALVSLLGPSLASRLMDSSERSYLFMLAFGVAAIGSLKMFFLSTLRNEGRARDYVRYSVDELLLGTLLSLGAVLWLRLGVTGLLIGPLVASTSVLLALAASFLRRVRFGLDGGQLRDALRVSLPLAPRALIGAVGNQLDRLVLGAVASLAGVGVYTIGQRIAQLVFAFMTALQNVYQPHVYRLFFANAPPRVVGEYLLPFAYASSIVGVGAILFSREIVRVVAPPEYLEAASVLAILSVHYGLMFFGKQPQLVFARRTGVVSILSVFAIVLNAAGVYVGANSGGAAGAATGMLVAGIVTGAAGLAAASHFAPIAYPLLRTTLIFAALPIALLAVIGLDALELPRALALGMKILLFAGFTVAGWRSGLIAAVWKGGSRSPADST